LFVLCTKEGLKAQLLSPLKYTFVTLFIFLRALRFYQNCFLYNIHYFIF
jgi:hypothetical protein